MTNAQNRQRWSVDQKGRARLINAQRIEPVSSVRVWRLAELKQMEESLQQFPHMAETLAAVRAEIASLT